MRFELKLAWVYFRARRKSTTRFTAIVAIAGITCGVASLIVAQSLTRGFAGEMREKILSNTEHVTVFQTNSREIQNWRIVVREIEKIENVQKVSPTTYENALLVSDKATSYAVLRARSLNSGVESQETKISESEIKSQKTKTPDSRLPTPDFIEISLGAELAEKNGLQIGDAAEIVLSSGTNESPPKTFSARIGNTFRTGIYDYDATWINVSPADLARVFDKPDFTPTVLSVSIGDVYAAGGTARKIREILPPDFKVVDWQEANQPLFAALSLERKISLAIISLIIFIAALNITTTLALLVNERRFDIALLRTCGARARSVMAIFLLEGLLLGGIGIFLGLMLGLAACFAGNYFRLINLPAEVYSVSYVPLIPNLSDVLLIAAIAFLLSLTATIYPARRAAQIKPLENLRRS